MISRTLLSALVGLSMAVGTVAAASAQTAEPATAAPATQMVSPGDATVPTAAAKTDTIKADTGKSASGKAKPLAAKAKHTRMKAKVHGKHLTQRTGQHVKTAGHPSAKRVRLSRLGRHGAGKHV